MTDKEKIKQLDAIINLYQNDPNDGLRNKIWGFIETLLKEREKEAFEGGKKWQRDFEDSLPIIKEKDLKEWRSNNLEG